MRGVIAMARATRPITAGFHEHRASYEGWQKANRHYWLADYRGWVEFFFTQVFTEPHSTSSSRTGWAGRWAPTPRRCC